MFAILLGSVIALGTGLLASASFTEGGLLASRTAAQLIGWALVLSPLLALRGIRRHAAEVGAAGIAVMAGAAVLYVAYFEWGSSPTFPEANAAEIVPTPVVAMPVAATLPVIPQAPIAAKAAAVPAPAPVAGPTVSIDANVIPDSPPY